MHIPNYYLSAPDKYYYKYLLRLQNTNTCCAWKIQILIVPGKYKLIFFSVPDIYYYEYLLCLQYKNTCFAWEILICGCLIAFLLINFIVKMVMIMMMMKATCTAAILSSSNFSWQSRASSIIWSMRSWESYDMNRPSWQSWSGPFAPDNIAIRICHPSIWWESWSSTLRIIR